MAYPEQRWDVIHVDFITDLKPTAEGFDTILTCTGRLLQLPPDKPFRIISSFGDSFALVLIPGVLNITVVRGSSLFLVNIPESSGTSFRTSGHSKSDSKPESFAVADRGRSHDVHFFFHKYRPICGPRKFRIYHNFNLRKGYVFRYRCWEIFCYRC